MNAAKVDPAFISAVRKKLRLDQQEAAELFGGGANAFARYENGKTKPPLAPVKLLDRHPDLLAEVWAGCVWAWHRSPLLFPNDSFLTEHPDISFNRGELL